MGRSLTKKRKHNQEWFQSGPFMFCPKNQSKTVFKVKGLGIDFTLREIEPKRWNLSGKNSDGSRNQSRFEAEKIDEAIRVSYSRLGYAFEPKARDVSIAAVLDKWMDTRDIGSRTKRHQYTSVVMAFLAFCEKNGLRFWSQLKLEDLEKWRNHCKRKYNGWTPYHYVGKIKMAARWASLNWRGHFTNIGDGLKVPKPDSDYLIEDRDALAIETVADFCVFLLNNEKGWEILPAVALCGFAGLGVEEALRLRWVAVQFDEGFIDVKGEVKNSHRRRRIPLPGYAWYILREAPRKGSRVVWKHSNYSSYGKAFDRLFNEWGGAPRIRPSDLREVLQTHAEVEGWDSYTLDRYVGHAGKTIRQIHYTKRSRDTLLTEMREKVTDRVDAVLAEWRAKCERNVNSESSEELK